ncbi:DUF6225 family protein [Streptomyces sp. NPDC048659]|uniref:DUF6225 family protein n=1 Tax=Streptomyces sp. NPDC048659 TaxID=3155489 RepID=UPI0034354D9C
MADDEDIELYRHETVELTVGELRAALAGLPADTPVRVDVPVRPRAGAMRDSLDSGHSMFVVCGVVLDDSDHLRRDELVVQADFCTEWYVRPAGSGGAPADED